MTILGNPSFGWSVSLTEAHGRTALADGPGMRTRSQPALDRRLGFLVQADTDMSHATVAVRRSLTLENCNSLIRVIARTSYLAANLSITVDLSEVKTIDQQALSRLRDFPAWTIVEPA